MRKKKKKYNVSFDVSNFPKAQELLNAVFSLQYQLIVYGGAIRGGKSYNLLGALVLLLWKYPGARAIVTRRSLETLKKNTLPTCKKLFPPQLKLVNSTSYIWEFPQRDENTPPSTLMFFGENYSNDKELSRWDGLEFNFILMDQMEELRHETFNKALERCGSYMIPGYSVEDQPPPILLASVNPTYNYVKRLIYKPWIKGELDPDWHYIAAKITDNPYISEKYKKSLEKMRKTNPAEYKRRVEGDWDYLEDSSMLYAPTAIEDIYYNDFVPGGLTYLTVDVAFSSDKFVIMCWEGWRCVEVFHTTKTEDTKLVAKYIRAFANKHKVPNSRIIYDSGGVGYYLQGYFPGSVAFFGGGAPVPVPRHMKPQAASPRDARKRDWVPAYQNLRSQCFFELAEFINFAKMYVVAGGETQDEITEELQAIEVAETNTEKMAVVKKDEIVAKIGRSPDFADCLSMRVFAEYTEQVVMPGEVESY